MTHELEVKVKAIADTSDLAKLKQDLAEAQEAAEKFRSALTEGLVEDSSDSLAKMSEGFKKVVSNLSTNITLGIGHVRWKDGITEQEQTLSGVHGAVVRLHWAKDASKVLKEVTGEVNDLQWGKVAPEAKTLDDVAILASGIANKNEVIEGFANDLKASIESSPLQISTDITLSTDIYKELDELALHPYSVRIAIDGLESVERARECLDSIAADCRYLETLSGKTLSISAAVADEGDLWDRWVKIKKVLDDVKTYDGTPFELKVVAKGDISQDLQNAFSTLAMYKGGISKTISFNLDKLGDKEYQDALNMKQDFLELLGDVADEVADASDAISTYVDKVKGAYSAISSLKQTGSTVKAAFRWDVENGAAPLKEEWPIKVIGTFSWGEAPDKEWPIEVIGTFSWGKGGDAPPKSPMDIVVRGFFEWEKDPPATIDLKGIVKGALELENNVVNVVAMAHVVPSSIDEGPTTGFAETGSNDGVRGWVKRHLGFASGNVAMVAEGGDDEMVVHKDLVRGGPEVLDRYHAYMFHARDEGTIVTTADGEDIKDNYHVIPEHDYVSFRNRIFRGFADGNVANSSAFGDSFSGIAGAFSGLMSALDSFDNLASRGIPPGQTTDLVLTRIDSLKTEFSKVETLLASIERSTSGMSVETATFVSDMIRQLTPLIEGLAEDIAIAAYDRFGESEITQKVDKVVDNLMSVRDMTVAISERLGKVGMSVENIEEDVDASAGAAGAGTSSTTTSGGPRKRSFSDGLRGIWDTYFSSKGDAGLDEEEKTERRRARAEMSNEVVSKAFSAGEDLHTKLLHKTFDLIQQIYGKMKEASPLLQTVETLFNLAMRLFFMPLGNKLAEVLIPATVDLVEKVTDMWDMFDENMTLGEMFSVAIKEGVSMLSEYFFSIGDTLKDQGGLIGRIGALISSVGGFLEDHGVQTLEFLLGIMDSVVHYFPELLGAIVGFKVSSLTQSIVNTYALAAAISQSGTLGNLASQGGLSFMAFMAAEAAMSMAPGIIAGTVTSGIVRSAMPVRHARGGYVPSSPDGTIVVAGEGGEGEYIIPESKMTSVINGGMSRLSMVTGGSTVEDVYYGGPSSSSSSNASTTVSAGNVINATYYINGYTDSELRNIIMDTVNSMTSDSRYKGRYW